MENQQTKFENWGDNCATSLRHELSQVNQFDIVLQRGRRMWQNFENASQKNLS